MKSNINYIKVHPQLNNNLNTMDDATMVACSLSPIIIHSETMNLQEIEGRGEKIFKLGAKHIH
jgi:hypothetical protein